MVGLKRGSAMLCCVCAECREQDSPDFIPWGKHLPGSTTAISQSPNLPISQSPNLLGSFLATDSCGVEVRVSESQKLPSAPSIWDNDYFWGPNRGNRRCRTEDTRYNIHVDIAILSRRLIDGPASTVKLPVDKGGFFLKRKNCNNASYSLLSTFSDQFFKPTVFGRCSERKFRTAINLQF